MTKIKGPSTHEMWRDVLAKLDQLLAKTVPLTQVQQDEVQHAQAIATKQTQILKEVAPFPDRKEPDLLTTLYAELGEKVATCWEGRGSNTRLNSRQANIMELLQNPDIQFVLTKIHNLTKI